MAIPAQRAWRTVRTADGTEIRVRLVGDEHGHWYVDEQGRALDVTDGVASYLEEGVIDARMNHAQERRARANAKRLERLESITPAFARRNAITNERNVYSGDKKGIVILVNFTDLKMKSTSTVEKFTNMFNQVGYSTDHHNGSVHDYFYDQSYGTFNLEFDIFGPVLVSKSYTYYGANNKDGDDKHPCEMVIEAVSKAKSLGADFSKYDWDDDGYVDQVFIVYAGYGEHNNGAPENLIWPHEWKLSDGKEYGDGTGVVSFDDKKINTYAVSCELSGTSGSLMNGIGTACHEFSHCLGYPDMYCTSEDGDGDGMQEWDLLDQGSYNGFSDNGECPAAFTAYERWMAGWLEPTVLSEPCYVKDMPALTDEPVAYIIYNDANTDECYMLENRQSKTWDRYIGGRTSCHGMLITHIDYDAQAWLENKVNYDKSHQRVTFFAADNGKGSYGYQSSTGYAGDPFPGTKKKTSFTDTTYPAATLYNANIDGRKFMGKPITEITETDGKISFTFMGGEAPDGIEIVTTENKTADRIYNLNGQQVREPSKGIYIVGGKKVLHL